MINYYQYRYEENEHLYGPGVRLVVFCQGCSLHCPGCVNKHLWGFGEGKNIATEKIVELCFEVEGITLLGGEPLDQSEGILDIIKALKRNGKTVVLFTGYNLKELNSSSQRESWKLSDIVISGRYFEKKRSIFMQFRGSTNQRVYTHKGKYKGYKVKDGKTVALFRINENGVIEVGGFQDEELKELTEKILINI